MVDQRLAEKLKLDSHTAQSFNFDRNLKWETATVPEVQSVSYTHLDVYKRQADASRWKRHRRSWLLSFLGFTAFGLLNFEYRYLDNLARGVHHTFAIRLFEEMTGAYVGLALFPLAIWAIRRARIRRDNWCCLLYTSRCV